MIKKICYAVCFMVTAPTHCGLLDVDGKRQEYVSYLPEALRTDARVTGVRHYNDGRVRITWDLQDVDYVQRLHTKLTHKRVLSFVLIGSGIVLFAKALSSSECEALDAYEETQAILFESIQCVGKLLVSGGVGALGLLAYPAGLSPQFYVQKTFPQLKHIDRDIYEGVFLQE